MPMEDSLLQLSAGKIRGRKDTLPNGESYYFYKGIPYAQQPLGNLRFKPPVPLDKFEEDVLDCGYERNSCHSLICVPPVVAVGEDCLHANVYSPLKPADVDQGRRLPVMVWIHGGAFNAGSGDSSWYCPRFLVQEGVVVVTFNYRIGPLGFLCLPSKGIHGNMGLKDQRLLLKWVHDNIAQFGGDSRNVTLFGESAGGASVHLHYLTESSRQYFHRAICQSGTAFNVWIEQQERDTKTRMLAQLLGCIGTSDEEIYETLMNASALDLTTHSEDCMSAYDRLCFRYFPFTPTVESDDSEEPFITEHYVDALKKPFKTHIPLISGFTSNEAIAMIPFGCMTMNDMLAMRMFPFTPTVESADSEEPFITENYTDILHRPDLTSIPLIIGFNSNESVTFLPLLQPTIRMFSQDPRAFVPAQLTVPAEELASVGAEIKRFYYGDDTAHCLTGFLDYVSDIWFIIPSFVASELQARFQQK
uniref:Carboxylic ester hydrolase n=1 Tax=Culex quinquefasciatus TaxID=7176 RepID=A0A1J0HZS9_CULQU|nr:esterase 5A transcript variant B [Culex quinquefasciatus]